MGFACKKGTTRVLPQARRPVCWVLLAAGWLMPLRGEGGSLRASAHCTRVPFFPASGCADLVRVGGRGRSDFGPSRNHPSLLVGG